MCHSSSRTCLSNPTFGSNSIYLKTCNWSSRLFSSANLQWKSNVFATSPEIPAEMKGWQEFSAIQNYTHSIVVWPMAFRCLICWLFFVCIVQEGAGLEGSRGGRVTWTCNDKLVIATGFDRLVICILKRHCHLLQFHFHKKKQMDWGAVIYKPPSGSHLSMGFGA